MRMKEYEGVQGMPSSIPCVSISLSQYLWRVQAESHTIAIDAGNIYDQVNHVCTSAEKREYPNN